MDFLNSTIKEIGYRWAELPSLGVFGKWVEAYPCKAYKPFDFVRPKLKVGIEVEVEGVRHHLGPHGNLQTVWRTADDGSLRNGGIELVSAPICDQFIPYAVHWLFDEYLPKQADFSDRTSIHVHVNVRNWKTGDVLNLMLLYIVFERLLYRFAGPQRYKNIFCVPIQETKLPVALSDYLANHNFHGLIGNWAKYSGLNLLPIKALGTVEYRHMVGHRDSTYLLNWINILQQLHRAADRSTFENLFNTIKVLNTTSMYEQFLRDTFQEQAVHFANFNFRKEMEYGVSVVKAIRAPSPFLRSLLENISNDSALLTALGLSENETKKPKTKEKKVQDVIPPLMQGGFLNNVNVEMVHIPAQPDDNYDWAALRAGGINWDGEVP